MMNDAEREDWARQWLLDHNKCGSKSRNGFLCTLTANHYGKQHKAQILGGIEDGKVLEEWDW
jgi:hypothetical protein